MWANCDNGNKLTYAASWTICCSCCCQSGSGLFFFSFIFFFFFFVARFVQVSSTSSFCAVYSQKTHINYARASKSHKMSNAANTKTKTQIATNEKTKHRQKSKKKKRKRTHKKCNDFFFCIFPREKLCQPAAAESLCVLRGATSVRGLGNFMRARKCDQFVVIAAI